MANRRLLRLHDLALLAAIDRDFRDRLIASLCEAFVGLDAKAGDYTLAGPGEGE